ncbi:GvpL/GvpF family gas vesicle protein [Nonomuraea sp. NPDC050643]|uniref:GvpL/GvpF family gas vesicle protein n=1 Tax=Nonomuraea sp. NPDC050643 TaxID=3155660 RepID=UPI0033D94257
MSEGTYLYAVARDPLPACPPGVAGGAVRTVTRPGLVAYVSTVPLERFGAAPPRRSLEDLDWLAETARAHRRVVDAVAAATTAAPIRLVTVYEHDDQVRDLLDRRGDDFLRMLERVTGRREWGVKAYAAPAGKPRVAVEAHTGEPATGHHHRRRAGLYAREHARGQARGQAGRRADDVHRALSALAAASHRHRAQNLRLSGRGDWMLLNGAYLVDDARAAEFAALAGTLGGDGVDLRLTGPWAPYSFTVMKTT